MATDRTFGMSAETESSTEASLSLFHEDFIRHVVEFEMERERAILEHWLASK